MFQEFALQADTPLSLISLLINLLVGVGLSMILSWHFKTFGSTLSNREEFSQVFPFILLTTILIITIIKSSLALSLGLVGALSIVRFRTPIKEPEELAYLFIAIAMGLGLGAGQTLVTVVAGIAILTVMAFLKKNHNKRENKNLYVSIDWQGDLEFQPKEYLKKVEAAIVKHSVSSDLRRFDVRDGAADVTYQLDIASSADLAILANELRSTFPNIGVTFLDQNQLPSL